MARKPVTRRTILGNLLFLLVFLVAIIIVSNIYSFPYAWDDIQAQMTEENAALRVERNGVLIFAAEGAEDPRMWVVVRAAPLSGRYRVYQERRHTGAPEALLFHTVPVRIIVRAGLDQAAEDSIFTSFLIIPLPIFMLVQYIPRLKSLKKKQ